MITSRRDDSAANWRQPDAIRSYSSQAVQLDFPGCLGTDDFLSDGKREGPPQFTGEPFSFWWAGASRYVAPIRIPPGWRNHGLQHRAVRRNTNWRIAY
jgi:hypothetical protein